MVYNASNNEFVQTQSLVKGAIVQVDAAPFSTMESTLVARRNLLLVSFLPGFEILLKLGVFFDAHHVFDQTMKGDFVRRDDWCRENGDWNPGIHKLRSFSSFEDSSFTLFVDNLPRDVGPRWFRSFFSKFGIVKKSFIPYKISKRSGCRFGFITFGKRDEADMAIAKAHGIRIDNRSLFVKMASFSKNDRSGVAGLSKDVGVQNGEYHTNVWKKGFKSFSEVVTGSDNFGSVIKLDELGNEWLLRSVTAKLAPSKSLVLVQDQLANLGYLNIQVRTMGGDFLVLTFPTVEACNAVFNNGEFAWLQEWFLEIHKWDKHRVIPPSRSVWLNCFGVPLHLWNSVTFKKIGQIWGNVLEISIDTIQETSFCVGKVLISTQTLDVINQVILVENKGVQFKIRVCEEQIVVNTILRAECNCKGCKEEGEMKIEENELVNRSEQGSHMEETKVEGAVDAVLDNDLNKSEQVGNNGSSIMDIVEETKEVLAGDVLGANDGTVGTPSSALNKSVNLEEDEAFLEEDSSSTHGLDSLVEDSGGPIREICGNKLLIQQITQDSEAHSEERSEEVAQHRVVEETCMDHEKNQKELEEKILLLDGPVVLGSFNNMRASQIPSINLLVELNPKEARKALRARISQSCGSASDENIAGPSASQGYKQNSILQELYSTTVVGDKLGIDYSDKDLRHMKKLIEDSTNRFAPLLRSISNN